MIKAILIDLDDTLLKTNMDQFLPAYLDRLAHSLRELGPAEEIIKTLYMATEGMIGNQDPTRTLKAAFDRRFYPALNTTEAELRQQIDRFYREIYPELRQLTEPVPQAASFLEALADKGLQIVIATNPLFPRTAIAQRMSWTDIEADDPSIHLVTSYEHFHFAKPQPAYYAEILGWLGIAASECVMIGDDPNNDLAPAQAIGIPSFRVNHTLEKTKGGAGLEEALQWIGERQEANSDEFRDDETSVLARLRGDLAALLQRVSQLSEELWRAQPGKRAWSALEILCHLRDTEREVNYPRIHTILTEATPFLSAANPDEWAAERHYQQQDPAQALAEFSQARQQTIARLANLSPEQWRGPARHALLGPTNLIEVMAVAADHDLLHLKQLRETLNELQDQ